MKEVVFVNNLTEFAKDYNADCQSYWKGSRCSTLITKECIYKCASGFDQDVDLANECLQIWKSKGYKGNPSSPASFFKMLKHDKGKVKSYHNTILSKRFHGGWIETIKAGSTRGAVYHQDIKKAYYWAGSQKLPVHIRPLTDVAKDFICVFKQSEIQDNVPNRFEREIVNVTNKDIDTYNLKGEILHGFNLYDWTYCPNDIVEKLNFLPEKAWKRLTQSYWGIWCSREPLIRKIQKSGKVKKVKMHNYFQNHVYAQIIVNRVIRKVYENINCKPLLIATDAILSEQPLKNYGEKIGDFVLKNKFQNGVYIKNAGFWTPYENQKIPNNKAKWMKHMGVPAGLIAEN